jgi:Ser/Thr protein kinase RdoA (MazF antagonist)
MPVLRRLLAPLLALALSLPALANPLQFDAIRAQQGAIRAGVEAHSTGAYKELSPEQRTEVLTRQARLLETIAGKQSEAELTPEQHAEITATLAWIDATLKAAEDERMVCERRQILGSNRKERVCMTASQMRAQREATRDRLDRRGVCDDCRGQ